MTENSRHPYPKNPSVQVAVASSDGIWVDLHFGHAHQFRIYAWNGTSFTLNETRSLRPGCNGGGHDAARLDAAADTVADCHAVLASRIGPGALDALLLRGLRPLAVFGTVDENLWELADSAWFKLLALQQEEPANPA